MHRYIVIACLFALVAFACMVSGCQTTPQQVTRADLTRYLDGAELALDVGLSLAEMHGADSTDLTTARESVMLAFGAARAAINVDLSELDAGHMSEAINNINTATDNVLALCERAGLPEARTTAIRNAIDSALGVLRQVVEART